MKAPADSDIQSLFPAEVMLLGTNLQDNVYTADFSSEYLNLNRDREVILRAGLAKTLTQVDGINYIRVTCGGQPLMDSAGNPVGTFSGSDFVDSIANINSYERMELTLYFADGAINGRPSRPRKICWLFFLVTGGIGMTNLTGSIS